MTKWEHRKQMLYGNLAGILPVALTLGGIWLLFWLF